MEVGVVRTWVWILTRRECIGSRDSRDSGSDEETEEGTHGELWYRGLGKKLFVRGMLGGRQVKNA